MLAFFSPKKRAPLHPKTNQEALNPKYWTEQYPRIPRINCPIFFLLVIKKTPDSMAKKREEPEYHQNHNQGEKDLFLMHISNMEKEKDTLLEKLSEKWNKDLEHAPLQGYGPKSLPPKEEYFSPDTSASLLISSPEEEDQEDFLRNSPSSPSLPQYSEKTPGILPYSLHKEYAYDLLGLVSLSCAERMF